MEKATSKLHNFIIRAISAIVLAPFALYAIIDGGFAYQLMLVLLIILATSELNHMTNHLEDTNPSKKTWKIISIIYVLLPISCLFWLRSLPNGASIVLWIVLLVWATDIFAYIVGNLVGGKKIYPNISPKKTWSGLIGGILAACITGFFAATLMHFKHMIFISIFSGILAICSQVGDFFESCIKRKFNIKDSGHLIPGHGGILDRVDGLMVVAVIIAIFTRLYGHEIF